MQQAKQQATKVAPSTGTRGGRWGDKSFLDPNEGQMITDRCKTREIKQKDRKVSWPPRRHESTAESKGLESHPVLRQVYSENSQVNLIGHLREIHVSIIIIKKTRTSLTPPFITHPVFSVDVRSVFQQQFDNRFVSIPRGKMKRSQRKLWKTGRNNAVKKAILMMVFYEINLESAIGLILKA